MITNENSLIDKTAAVEERLRTSAAVCLCGMPGVGKKTLVRLLLGKHPEVHVRICTLEELKPVDREEREGKSCTWYLVRTLEKDSYPDLEEQLWEFFRKMPEEDKVIFATEGEVPRQMLSFIWNGAISQMYPENFWFTKQETRRYLKEEKSVLDGEEVYQFTCGWAGCIALLVRMQRQLSERWSLEELCRRYEIQNFVKYQILDRLSEEEQSILRLRAAYPRINRELAELLWGDVTSEAERGLFMRGLMIYSPTKRYWQVHPVIRRCLRADSDKEQCLKAVQWYEEKGLLEDALECCRNMNNRDEYERCLVRNYDRAAFLQYEKYYDIVESSLGGPEIFYLCGIRDLTVLFACTKKEAEGYRRLWKERLSEENYKGYRLAAVEYAFMVDQSRKIDEKVRAAIEEIREKDSWQLRIGQMYILYLYALNTEGRNDVRSYMRDIFIALLKEESEICRYNATVLYYLAEAKWGENEDIIRWIRSNDGDIANKAAKTELHLMAQVKIHFHFSNYSQADKLLNVLLPYLKKYNLWKYRAEALFQKALVEKEKGRDGGALRYAAESFQIASPYRYVRIYTGYGKLGLELLEYYYKWMGEQNEYFTYGKKQYKYGSVLRMPYVRWIDYIIRKAKKGNRNYSGQKKKDVEEFHVEKLTVTERLVLQYLQQGYSNMDIGNEMNIKLSTVKSHIYNIYKKLGVSSRIQAVQKGKEEGIL